jgi:multiple sugar transport system substrate-binding protein
VQYDNMTDDVLQKTITASLQNGNAPDVFRIPVQYTLAQLVESGQVAALDDIIPNFATWKAAFPPNGFLTGANIFNGKTYSFPQNSDHAFGALLYYNTAYLPSSEYDLAHQPLTWDTFRATAKKVTQQGAGKYYGYLIAGGVTGRWSLFVDTLAQLAGAAGGAINWKTGEYQYTSDQHLGAIQLLLAMKSDGSIFPGSVSLNQQDAVSRMGTGVAGIFLSEASNIPVWIEQNPDFKFDVGSPPQPNSGPITPITTMPGGSFWVAYAKSKYQQISGDIFAYLGSTVGQVAYARAIGGGTRLFFPEASTIPELDPRSRRGYQLFDQLTRVGPSPAVRNPDIQLVYREQRPLQPDFGTTVQGLYTGQLKDPKAAMKDLQDRSEAELQRAIKAAQAKGAKVSREDWKFPNWDPTKDYTQADYDALK